MFESRTTCRSCGSADLTRILSLGVTPLADRLVAPEQVDAPEVLVPLNVAFCSDCSLMQILETVSPEILYCQDYPYYSSFSPELLRHSKNNAFRLAKSRHLDGNSLAVEIASNDGYLLKNFVELGIPVLGIDPADGPARAAVEAGIETMCMFFNRDLAVTLAEQGRKADVIIANNVLAHVPDQNNFVQGIREILKDDGVAVIEMPYVRDLIDHCEFDTIYHEHHCYFSVTSLRRLFEQNGLFLNHVQHHSIHGGSLRIFVEKTSRPSEAFLNYLRDEAEAGVDTLAYYQNFASRVEGIKTSLVSLVEDLKSSGKTIAAYGAAAKGSTLLNTTGIGPDLIDFVADRNVHKQGNYMPGVRIPISTPKRILKDRPDYLLILAWNFKDEIIRQQDDYRRLGGRFIVPVPEPAIV